jgi:S-adenosylmethionine:tRNA-ribosyltransferase-isomerase (queuine synthetase)
MPKSYSLKNSLLLIVLLISSSISLNLNQKNLKNNIDEKKLPLLKAIEKEFTGPISNIINEKEFLDNYPDSLQKKNERDDFDTIYSKIYGHLNMLQAPVRI